MINWVIGLFVAAVIAASLGFGGVATTFAATAQVIFFILLTLFVVSAVIAMIGGQAPLVHKVIRTASLIVLVAAVSIGAYAWIENGLSAERVGRSIDLKTATFAHEAGAAFSVASQRTQTFWTRTVDDMRHDTASNVEPSPQKQETSRE